MSSTNSKFTSAIEENDILQVALMLHEGICANTTNFYGATALMIAAAEGHSEIVELLLSHKADMYELSRHNETAMSYATHHGHTNVVRSLLNAGYNVNAPTTEGANTLFNPIISRNMELLELFLSLGADPHHTDSNSLSALQQGIYGSDEIFHEVVAEKLLGYADINSLDKYGNTLLMSTIISRNPLFSDIAKFLIEKGVDIDVQNLAGDTALILAAKYYGKQSHDLINLLLNSGADRSIKNHDGRTIDDFLARIDEK